MGRWEISVCTCVYCGSMLGVDSAAGHDLEPICVRPVCVVVDVWIWGWLGPGVFFVSLWQIFFN